MTQSPGHQVSRAGNFQMRRTDSEGRPVPRQVYFLV